MKYTAALMMALGLALPAISFGQEDRLPSRGGDGPPPRESRREGSPREWDGPRRERFEQRQHMGPRGDRPMRGQGFRDGQRPLPPPLFGALDANRDGAIDQREMRDAPRLLGRLDRNDDGRVTPDEMRPGRGRQGGGDRDDRGPRPPRFREDDRERPGMREERQERREGERRELRREEDRREIAPRDHDREGERERKETPPPRRDEDRRDDR